MSKKVKLNEGMLVYTTVYTCFMLFLGILSSLKYIFILKIPFIPLIFFMLCIIQCVFFCISSHDGIIGLLYKVNIAIAILLILNSNITTASEILMVCSVFVVVVPGFKSYKSLYPLAVILIASIAKLMFSLVESSDNTRTFLFAQIMSVLVSLTCIFTPYLPDALEYIEYDRYVKVDNPTGKGSENMYAEVEKIIDFGVLQAVKIDGVKQSDKLENLSIKSEYSKKLSEEHVTKLLRGIKENDLQEIYAMFSEDAKTFGVSEHDIEKLGVLRGNIYKPVDLSNLSIFEEYHYKKGHIIRNFTYDLYIKQEGYVILIEGQQEITSNSMADKNGIFCKVVIYPMLSPEVLDRNLPAYGIYVFTDDVSLVGD